MNTTTEILLLASLGVLCGFLWFIAGELMAIRALLEAAQ